MTIGKKPHRRLCRRPKHFLQVPIGVSFRRQHLQRTMLHAFRRVKVKAMKKEIELLKKSYEKERVELTELQARFAAQLKVRLTRLEARFTQLRAERRHVVEESAWTQAWRRHGGSAPRPSLRSLMT